MYLVQEWLYAAAEGEPEPEEDPRCGFGTPDDHQEAKALMRQLRALGLVRTGKTLALPELLKETVRSEYGDEDEEEYDEYEDYDEEDFDEAV